MPTEEIKKVTKNLAVLTVTRVIIWVSTFLLMLFLPRYLGPVEYGRFYLGQSIIALFAILIEFGGNYSIAKAVSRTPGNIGHILVDSLAIRSIMWLFAFCTLVVYMNVAGYPQSVKVILLIFGLSLVWSTARSVLTYGFGGFELMEYPSYGTMGETVFVSAVGIAALLSGVGAIGFTVITVLGSLVGFLICTRFLPRIISSFPPVNWKNSYNLLKEGVPYFLNTLFGIIYYRIDTVMLSLMVSERIVGWYGASYRFFDSLMFVPLILAGALYPRLTRLWKDEPDSIHRTVQKGLDFIMIVGVPISIGVFAFSKEIIRFFYGLQGYFASVLLLKIFAIGNILVYIDVIIGNVLLAADKQRQLSINAFVAIFINIGLNYLLIPRFQLQFGNGAIGSAIATILTELYVMSVMVLMLPKKIIGALRIGVQLKALFAGILMALFIWMIQGTEIMWIAQAVLSSFVFIATLFLTKTFTAADVALAQTVMPDWLSRRFSRIRDLRHLEQTI